MPRYVVVDTSAGAVMRGEENWNQDAGVVSAHTVQGLEIEETRCGCHGRKGSGCGGGLMGQSKWPLSDVIATAACKAPCRRMGC